MSEVNKSRVERHQELYRTLYEGELKPIDVETTIKTVDPQKKSETMRESFRNKLGFLGEEKKVTPEPVEEKVKAAQVYDINSLIDDAKSKTETTEAPEKIKKLNSTQYDILKKLDISNREKPDGKEVENKDSEDQEDPTVPIVFKELMPDNDDTIVTESIFKDEIPTPKPEEPKPEEKSMIKADNLPKELLTKKADVEKKKKDQDTFYTGKFKFSKEEIDNPDKIKKAINKNNVLIKILLMFLGVVITVLILYIVNNYVG